jgi:DNA replication protein DnaC
MATKKKTTTMTDDLDQLLKTLSLKKIREVLPRELDRAATSHPSYADFLARLLREEALYRRERSVLYRISQAKIPEQWSIDSFPFDRQPGVRPAQIRQLAELDWVGAATNLVFIGPTGVGKTSLASGLLLKALENGYRGLFLKAQDLFDELYTSLADRSTRKLLDRLARVDVLLVDEMGYLNLRPEQTNAFFKLMEERYRRRPTLITTNLIYDDWYGFLGNKQMVSALLDRLRHQCHTIHIEGPSLRSPSKS